MAFSAPFRPVLAKPFNAADAINPLASVPWVAQWKFNDDATDSIGSNTLTGTGSPGFGTGKIGRATALSGIKYWTVADNASLSMGDIDFTLLVWVYFDSVVVSNGIGCKWTVTGNKREYLLFYNRTDHLTNNRFTFAVSNDGTAPTILDANTFGAASVSTWYCVAAWHDSVANTINIQINNGAIDSAAYSAGVFDGTAPFEAGAVSGSNYPMQGRIDNLCIAKSAAGGGGVLTAAQRTAFYNAGAGTEVLR